MGALRRWPATAQQPPGLGGCREVVATLVLLADPLVRAALIHPPEHLVDRDQPVGVLVGLELGGEGLVHGDLRRHGPTTTRVVEPDEGAFTGLVFKIQANMDPAHRDRVAFVRICSGRFERGLRVRHQRSERELTQLSFTIVPDTRDSDLTVRRPMPQRERVAAAGAGRPRGVESWFWFGFGLLVLSEGYVRLALARRKEAATA